MRWCERKDKGHFEWLVKGVVVFLSLLCFVLRDKLSFFVAGGKERRIQLSVNINGIESFGRKTVRKMNFTIYSRIKALNMRCDE